MADWSQLPKDLLIEISDIIRSPIGVLRLRSVCSAWRSAVQPKRRSLPNMFFSTSKGGTSRTNFGFRLFKNTIYRIAIPPAPDSAEGCDWIVKISEDVNRMQLLNPLSGERLKPLLPSLDFLKFRVCELGEEYVMHLVNKWPFSNWFGEGSRLYKQKVAFRLDGDRDGNPSFLNANAVAAYGFMLLTISASGRLVVLKSGDKKRNVIEEMLRPYVDVKLYKGKFYAVDSTGRMVIVESASKIKLAAVSVFGGDSKRLVESCGSLLLFDMQLTMKYGFDDDEEDEEDRYLRCFDEKSIRIKVYKLVESEKKWEEMESLGDQILFLGKHSTFAVSAADISGYEGNCIFIMYGIDETVDRPVEFQAAEVAVYHLHSRKIEFLDVNSKHWKLFWPPPAWVTHIVGGQEGLGQEQMYMSWESM